MNLKDLMHDWWRDDWGECAVVFYADKGFMSYQLIDDEIFIRHFYVLPEFRGGGIGTSMFEECKRIGRLNKKKMLTSAIELKWKGVTQRIALFLHHKLEIYDSDKDNVYMGVNL
ncbi:MAG: hypothetical protein DRQ88_09330 [Epsilonproteobacteria bacterium]|nr:MAG: hypothetical protein DRQ88_09330 [Campylobacterota bacterium]